MTEFVLTSLVNSILNSDGTITVSSATGNVTLSLALGHINMWTAAQNNTSSWSSYVLSTDTYPQAELVASGGGGQLLLGIGGATSPTVTLQYGGAPGVLYLTTGVSSHSANMVVFGNAPGSGDSNAILTLYGIAGTNFEYMVIDAIQQTSYVWNTIFGGSGANRPIVFESNSTEAFRITTTPNVQLASTVNLNWNNDTFIQRNGAASIQIVGGTSVATKFYISDLGVNDFIITTGSPTTINTDGSVALVFQSGGNEAFRITSTPIVQMQPTALTILGSSTGYTTFTTNNASSTDYTATFPANTGTVAELNLAQSWSTLQTFGTNISFFGAQLSGTVSSGQYLHYNGTNWIGQTVSGGPTTYRATSNQTTSSAFPINSTYFTFSALSNTVYYLDCFVYVGNNTSNSYFQVGFAAPTGTTGSWSVIYAQNTGNPSAIYTPQSQLYTAFNTAEVPIPNGSNTDLAIIKAIVHVGSTAGTVALAFGAVSASGSTSEIYADSMMVVYSGV